MNERTIAVLTASDAGARGEREDTSGQVLREGLARVGRVVASRIEPDDEERLVAVLRQWVAEGIGLIATTGGTGLGPRDVTPEATRRVIEREVPGIAEEMRRVSASITPFGMLSRGVVGVAGQSLIINFPGSPKACRELLPVVLPILPHALDLLAGRTHHH
ncbi:MAG: MogA/MoaB family molybdenum cofactor biosynthesis protein [Firmicutes bacterium]|nr:MogA/MoaB family molybdenum cofactor biosynthesis protein [Alicyclobacillaceae bacterium]MCL6497923.1 MogA/MoaB family molybdenum cofactor biosynthesis protein [Bacillota bacterium]